MIGNDIAHEAAESRPIIVEWMTKTTLFFASLLLVASIFSLISSVRQLMMKEYYSAVKPAGELYSIKSFEKYDLALQEARRISGARVAK